MRIGLIISYDGTGYCGWQRQENGISVQEKIEDALRELTGEDITLTAAGRTDAGVHALAQTAHFDTESGIPAEKFSYAINTALPDDIRIKESFRARDDFHARYDVTRKTYVYNIWNDSHASAILRNYSFHVPRDLDLDAMEEAAEALKGEHDYTAFCAAGAQTKNFVRTVYDIDINTRGRLISFEYTGNGFLYNMVRILTGTLVYVGLGKLAPSDMGRIIESKDRTRAGVTVPPEGLFLKDVYYSYSPRYSGMQTSLGEF